MLTKEQIHGISERRTGARGINYVSFYNDNGEVIADMYYDPLEHQILEYWSDDERCTRLIQIYNNKQS